MSQLKHYNIVLDSGNSLVFFSFLLDKLLIDLHVELICLRCESLLPFLGGIREFELSDYETGGILMPEGLNCLEVGFKFFLILIDFS